MSSRAPASVIVVGAGVLGLATAARLAHAGLAATVLDPDPEQGGASAVAAGMISPGFELALGDRRLTAAHAPLHRAAWEAWPAFAETAGIALRRDGARWVGFAGDLPERFAHAGFPTAPTEDGFFAPEEGLVEPRSALARLRAAVAEAGGRVESARALALRADPERPAVETIGGRLEADRVIVACGWATARLGGPLTKAAMQVSPIKGQIAILRPPGAAPLSVLRGPGVYAVPRPDGTVAVGATMEPGRSDTGLDPGMLAGLRLAAADLSPLLEGSELVRGEAGVRGASPDGLPLVGRAAAGVEVALAPRRNGWLLAPLVADVLLASAKGDEHPFAARLDPLRFSPG